MKTLKIKYDMIFIIILLIFIRINVFSIETFHEGTVVEDIEIDNKIKDNDNSKNINIDMQIVYGHQYDKVLSTINLSQEEEKFVYLLSSYSNRANDVGYDNKKYINSSFYENRIGFTGNFNVNERWELIFDSNVNNDSRGMFDNLVYNREEKDKVQLSVKNISKLSTSFEGYLTLGGAGYVHRLEAIDIADQKKMKLNRMNIETGGEYIWSAYNRVRYSVAVFQYNYLVDDIEDDRYLDSEIIDDINLIRNIGISLGLGYDWNKDEDALPYPFPIVGLSIKGFKNISSFILYRYDIVPFKPEDFYLKQKFIEPSYYIPPGRVHHGDLKVEYRMNKIVSLKGNFMIEKNNNFYNYDTKDYEKVLIPEPISVIFYNTKVDTNLMFYEKILELAFSFEFSYFDADKNITYFPTNKFSNTIKFNGRKWKFEWTNEFIDRVYTDPNEDNRLDEAMIGYFGIQRQVHDGFYAYLRIENLYNNKYNLREGYPEPGFQLLYGLRILI